MLAAAHILAMDAKNLLDVIDGIRMRHPEVDALICAPLGAAGPASLGATPVEPRSMPITTYREVGSLDRNKQVIIL